MANSQSPLCWDQIAKKDARLYDEFSVASTNALSVCTAGQSQNGCFIRRASGSHQTESTRSINTNEGNDCLRMHRRTRCRTGVTVYLQQKPRRQGCASEVTHLIPTASITNWQASLNLSNFRQFMLVLGEIFQQCVKFAERRVISRWAAPQKVNLVFVGN